MAMTQVNPTRMELTRLKKKLKTAMRGHKLLKDKRDELMKQFMEIVKENRALRVEVEEQLKGVYSNFLIAGGVMSPQVLESAVAFPKVKVAIDVVQKNIMSVNVPQFTIIGDEEQQNPYPYGYYATTQELDLSVQQLQKVLPKMLRLAEKEKTTLLLAAEIESTRRRVNALEYVMIPDLTHNIRYITMKLDENERGNLTRLMKVKDMMIKEMLEAKNLAELNK